MVPRVVPSRHVVPSQMDADHLQVIRRSVHAFLKRVASVYGTTPGRLLDIAPQVHEGARPFFPESVVIETFDIDPNAGCMYTGDICERNECLGDEMFDYVVCTEVLEHTLRPWDAVNEIWRILKFGRLLFLTVPFNFRIHGPLPDCWRFTEYGLRSLFSRFVIVELNAVETTERSLMPVHYTMVARKE